MFKKGDLVKLVKLTNELENEKSECKDLVGIILDIVTWPEYDQQDSITDLFVCWSNGEKYWYSETAVIVISN